MLSQENILYILLIASIYCLLSLLMAIFMLAIFGYIIFIYFKKKIFNYEIQCFSRKTQTIINKYGKYRIRRVFLTNTPINLLYIYCTRIFLQFDLTSCFHPSLIVELETTENNNTRQWIRIEKNEGIYLSDTFSILNNTELIPLKKQRGKKMTLLDLLEKTKNNMGTKTFYTWHILNNNCQDFIIELLKTMNILTNKVKNKLCQKNLFHDIEVKEHHFFIYMFDLLFCFLSFFYNV